MGLKVIQAAAYNDARTVYSYCIVLFSFSFQVSAIFCCSSSNSTMSQPATQVSVQPPDTFSIYSYSKQPVVTSDTLRSGPLADTLRNETLLRDTGASPQYRVKTYSMTQLLMLSVAHSTKPSFSPKTNNQPLKKFLSLALSSTKVVKNGKILTFKVNFLCQKISESF